MERSVVIRVGRVEYCVGRVDAPSRRLTCSPTRGGETSLSLRGPL